jgi:hypothetical protein
VTLATLEKYYKEEGTVRYTDVVVRLLSPKGDGFQGRDAAGDLQWYTIDEWINVFVPPPPSLGEAVLVSFIVRHTAFGSDRRYYHSWMYRPLPDIDVSLSVRHLWYGEAAVGEAAVGNTSAPMSERERLERARSRRIFLGQLMRRYPKSSLAELECEADELVTRTFNGTSQLKEVVRGTTRTQDT